MGGETEEIVFFFGNALFALVEGHEATFVEIFANGLGDGYENKYKDEDKNIEGDLVGGIGG